MKFSTNELLTSESWHRNPKCYSQDYTCLRFRLAKKYVLISHDVLRNKTSNKFIETNQRCLCEHQQFQLNKTESCWEFKHPCISVKAFLCLMLSKIQKKKIRLVSARMLKQTTRTFNEFISV